jgi:hypothetical protein
MPTINELLVRLDASTEGLRREFARAEQTVNQSSGNMQKALGRIDQGVAGLIGTFRNLVPVLSAGALVAFSKSALDAAGAIGETAEQVGLTTDQLQSYEFAAVQAGVKSEDLQSAFQRLRNSIGEAAQGSDAQIKAFQKLGIGILDVNGKVRSSNEVFKDLAKAYTEAEDKAVFFANAQDLLGRGAQKLAPLLNGGADGVDRFVVSAQAAGVVLSNDLIEQADKASDAVAALGVQFSKTGQIAIAKLAPGLSAVVDSLRKVFFETDIESADRLIAKFNAVSAATTGYAQERERILKRLIELQPDQFDPTGGQAGGGGAPIRPGGGRAAANTNPPSKAESDAIKAATEALEKKVAAQKAEADGQYQSAAAKAQAQATEETLIALRAKGIKGLNDEQKALIASLGVQVQRIEAQKTELENVRAYAQTLNEYVDNATEAANAEAVLGGQVIKTTQATEENVRLLNEQADAAAKSTIRFNAATNSFELYDRELQVVIESQRLLRENTAMTTEEARRQAEQIVDATDRLQRGTDDIRKRVDNMNEAAQDFSRVIGTAFEDAVVSGGKLSDVLKGIAEDIARIILRLIVTKPLENALTGLLGGGSGGGGIGGIFSSLFSGGSTASTSGWSSRAQGFGTGNSYGNMDLGGFFADGGRPPVGMPSVVGENGPELFVPDRAGTIVSNDNLGAIGGNSVVVHQSFNFTGDVTAQTRAEVLRLAPALQQQTIAAIENRQQRGRRV